MPFCAFFLPSTAGAHEDLFQRRNLPHIHGAAAVDTNANDVMLGGKASEEKDDDSLINNYIKNKIYKKTNLPSERAPWATLILNEYYKYADKDFSEPKFYRRFKTGSHVGASNDEISSRLHRPTGRRRVSLLAHDQDGHLTCINHALATVIHAAQTRRSFFFNDIQGLEDWDAIYGALQAESKAIFEKHIFLEWDQEVGFLEDPFEFPTGFERMQMAQFVKMRGFQGRWLLFPPEAPELPRRINGQKYQIPHPTPGQQKKFDRLKSILHRRPLYGECNWELEWIQNTLERDGPETILKLPSELKEEGFPHAMVLVGVHRSKKNFQDWVVTVKNSWGPHVGDNGYFYIDLQNLVDTWSCRFYDVTFPFYFIEEDNQSCPRGGFLQTKSECEYALFLFPGLPNEKATETNRADIPKGCSFQVTHDGHELFWKADSTVTSGLDFAASYPICSQQESYSNDDEENVYIIKDIDVKDIQIRVKGSVYTVEEECSDFGLELSASECEANDLVKSAGQVNERPLMRDFRGRQLCSLSSDYPLCKNPNTVREVFQFFEGGKTIPPKTARTVKCESSHSGCESIDEAAQACWKKGFPNLCNLRDLQPHMASMEFFAWTLFSNEDAFRWNHFQNNKLETMKVDGSKPTHAACCREVFKPYYMNVNVHDPQKSAPQGCLVANREVPASVHPFPNFPEKPMMVGEITNYYQCDEKRYIKKYISLRCEGKNKLVFVDGGDGCIPNHPPPLPPRRPTQPTNPNHPPPLPPIDAPRESHHYVNV